MSIDLIIQSGTKFALEQWLDARGLGDNVQDTDATSPTFGQYKYTHTAEGSFYYWNHPSGKVQKNSAGALYAGFYARLSFPDASSLTAPRYETQTSVVDGETITTVVEIPSLSDWVGANTAVAVLDGVAGVGGAGIVILDPEDLRQQIIANGAPMWDGLIGVGNEWSDPALWAFSNVMTGDERDFDGVVWQSTIDFNVWSPTQYPQGWTEVGPAEPPAPTIDPWVQPVGAVDAYTLGALVTYQGQTWENTGSNANVWAPGVFGWTVVP